MTDHLGRLTELRGDGEEELEEQDLGQHPLLVGPLQLLGAGWAYGLSPSHPGTSQGDGRERTSSLYRAALVWGA